MIRSLPLVVLFFVACTATTGSPVSGQPEPGESEDAPTSAPDAGGKASDSGKTDASKKPDGSHAGADADDGAEVDSSAPDAGPCRSTCTPGACSMSNGCGGTCHCSPSEKCAGTSCVPLCDPVAQTGCAQGQACVRDGSGALRCEPPGTAGLGANCDPNGFYVKCAAGYACTYENAEGGYLNPGVCREYCDSDADCSNGAHCAYNGTSKNPTCTLPCNPLSGTTCTINPQLTCTTLFTDDGSPNCTFYGATTYAVNAGGLCDGSANGSWYHCKNGLVCLPDASGTANHCRAYCVIGTSCASGACTANPWPLDKTYGHCP